MPIRPETKLAPYIKFKSLFKNKSATIETFENETSSILYKITEKVVQLSEFGNLILESSVISHGKMRAFALFHSKKIADL